MEDNDLWTYLQSKASPDLQKRVQLWLAESPSNQAYFSQLKKIWTGTQNANFQKANKEEAWQKLRQQVPAKRRRLWRPAAAASVLLCLGFFLWYSLSNPIVRIHSEDLANAIPLVLPDSSLVWLNTNSEISYPRNFKGDLRQINLEGEAFFEVKKNPQKAFVVQSDQLEVKVLGTAFLVSNYQHEEHATVTVQHGLVAVKNLQTPSQELQLAAEEQAMYQKLSNGNLIKQDYQPHLFSWQSGDFIFKDQPLDEVLATLEKYYKKKIRLERNQLKDCRFNGRFTKKSLDDILEAISFVFNFTIEKSPQQITLKAGNC